ncbi:MAG: glycosyltransferase family 4 protein [Candidatus Micrarchaeaceae archaeon]
MRYKHNVSKKLLKAADLRIWHMGLAYPLLKLVRQNDFIYFHNFGFPYLTDYPSVEITSSRQLQDLKYIKLNFITPSNFNKETLMRLGFPEQSITVLPLFHKVNLPFKVHDPPSKPTLLTYGRYANNKAVPEIAKMAKEADLGLIAFGDNYTTHEYKKQYTECKKYESNNIKIYGKLPSIDGVFNDANIYISNSYHEGFNMPLIEAEAHSLPVLARRGTAMDELVKDGYNGFLFDDISEVPDLADKIMRNYATMSYNAWKHSQGYTLDKYKERYLRILEEYRNFR